MLISNPIQSEQRDKIEPFLTALIILILFITPIFFLAKGTKAPSFAKKTPVEPVMETTPPAVDSVTIVETETKADATMVILMFEPVTADPFPLMDKLKTVIDASTTARPLKVIPSAKAQSEEDTENPLAVLVFIPETADPFPLFDELKTALKSPPVPQPVEETPEIQEQLEEDIPTQPETHKIYVTKHGEDLWRIAGRASVYGDPTKWIKIYQANKDKIKNPNAIYANQELVIPVLENEE